MPRKWSDWIPWEGGECPVPPDTVVDVKLDVKSTRSPGGLPTRLFFPAKKWFWDTHNKKGPTRGDIIAYAVATDEDEA